jgi:hypothetical protein
MSMSDDALEQSKRLLEKRESDQAEFEARVRDSKKASRVRKRCWQT